MVGGEVKLRWDNADESMFQGPFVCVLALVRVRELAAHPKVA